MKIDFSKVKYIFGESTSYYGGVVILSDVTTSRELSLDGMTDRSIPSVIDLVLTAYVEMTNDLIDESSIEFEEILAALNDAEHKKVAVTLDERHIVNEITINFTKNLAAIKQTVNEANKIFCFDDCPMTAEFDPTFFQFMSDNKLSMNYIKEDMNGLPVYIIIGTHKNLEKFIDVIYSCGIQAENNRMKKFIKPYSINATNE